MKSLTDLNRSTAPEKKGSWPNPQHDSWPICESVPSFSLKTTNEVVGKSQASVNNQLLGLLGIYHQYAIGIFNTCLRRPTHRSLTHTGGGYSLEGGSFPQSTLWPSQPIVFTFHLRAPPGLQFNHKPSIIPNFEFKGSMAATWSSDRSTIYHGLHLCLVIANDLYLAIGFTMIHKKIILMQLGYQFNSYNLMHIQVS
jgi:hypothetical protein